MPYKKETWKRFTMIRIKKDILKSLRKMKVHPNQSDSEVVVNGSLEVRYKFYCWYIDERGFKLDMAGLSKQHFKAIAEIINGCLIYDEQGDKNYHRNINGLLIELCNYFKTQNPNFDEARFKEACLK